jgi:outer membrane lipoprotein SlyB
MRPGLAVLGVSLCLLGAAACEPQPSPTTFTRSESMRAQPVAFGQVVSTRNVDIRPGQTHLGMVTGGALGAIAGSQIGGGTASNVAGGIGGAVAGGMLGSAIQGSQVTRAVEVTVTLDSGQTVAIIQPGTVQDFRPGDRVRVVGTSDNARVTR